MASLREYIKDLNIWRRKNTLQTSDDIEVYSNSNGMTSLRLIKDLGIIGSSSTQSEYTGYFKVIEIDDTHVKVVDGADPDSAYCGYVTAGYTRVWIPASGSLAIIAGTVNYVYLDYVTANYSGTIKIGTALPGDNQQHKYAEVAKITISDGKINAVYPRNLQPFDIVRWL